MMVACVCGETTKNKVGPKKSQCILELIDSVRLVIIDLASNMVWSISDKMLVWSWKQQRGDAPPPKNIP
jgi:hypothetical protein